MSQARSKLVSLSLIAAIALALASCGSPAPEGIYKLGQPYQIAGRWYYPEFDPDYDQVGVASWYGQQFHGRPTANGEIFDREQLTAAHPTLPLPSIVRVTNLTNRRQVALRVNDRGPFVGDRLIDLSQAAARKLGFERQGITDVRVEFVSLAEAKGEPPSPTPHRGRREPQPSPVANAVVAAAPAAYCSPSFLPSGGHFIQVGAFARPEQAMRTAAHLYGMTVLPVSTLRPPSDHLIRVRLGPVADAGAARATLSQLRRNGYSGAFIVGPDVLVRASC